MLNSNPDIEIFRSLFQLQRQTRDFTVVMNWLLDERATLIEKMARLANEELYRVQGAYQAVDTLIHCMNSAQEQVRVYNTTVN